MTDELVNSEAAVYLNRPANYRARVSFADFLAARHDEFEPTEVVLLERRVYEAAQG